MKLLQITPLIAIGRFPGSRTRAQAEEEICIAIGAIHWPPLSNKFTIYPQSGKKRGEGNGVKPIKLAFIQNLIDQGWHAEMKYPRGEASKREFEPGAFDAWRETAPGGGIVVEWETGNISSSHRAVNKMALALLEEHIAAGYLVLPSRALYSYLTDRVGNYRELEPYFSLWERLPVRNGMLAIIEVEHDATSKRVPRIAKGTDGRALS